MKIFLSGLISLLFIITAPHSSHSQKLKPGFDAQEYIELLKVSARHADTMYHKRVPAPKDFKLHYRSPVTGLDNRWDLWVKQDSMAVISIRGTTFTTTSWMANFYAAMVPAKGALLLSPNDTFNYELVSDNKATVQVGWLLSTAFLARSILPKIDSMYASGHHHFYIMGHSQGGAIAYMLIAHLYHLQQTGQLPADIYFKTYCSAAPKPGNLFFAYGFEGLTKGGWAYTVVNAADWVPETPVTIQKLQDFNRVNPFSNYRKRFRKQGLFTQLLLGYVYRKLDKPTRKAVKRYIKYLGNYAHRIIQRTQPQLPRPSYSNTLNYARAGIPIVLMPDEEYYKRYPENPEKIFSHHLFEPYLTLMEKWQGEVKVK